MNMQRRERGFPSLPDARQGAEKCDMVEGAVSGGRGLRLHLKQEKAEGHCLCLDLEHLEHGHAVRCFRARVRDQVLVKFGGLHTTALPKETTRTSHPSVHPKAFDLPNPAPQKEAGEGLRKGGSRSSGVPIHAPE